MKTPVTKPTKVNFKEKHFKYKFKDFKIISDIDIFKLKFYEGNMAFDEFNIYNFIFEKYNNKTIYIKVETSTEQFKDPIENLYDFFNFLIINYNIYSYMFVLDEINSLKDLREDSDRDCGYYGFLYKKLILENPECVEYFV